MSVTLTQAQRIIAAADAKAAELGVPSFITVLDDGARMVASVRQDGAPLVSIDSSFAKARTSVYFGGAATSPRRSSPGRRSTRSLPRATSRSRSSPEASRSPTDPGRSSAPSGPAAARPRRTP